MESSQNSENGRGFEKTPTAHADAGGGKAKAAPAGRKSSTGYPVLDSPGRQRDSKTLASLATQPRDTRGLQVRKRKRWTGAESQPPDIRCLTFASPLPRPPFAGGSESQPPDIRCVPFSPLQSFPFSPEQPLEIRRLTWKAWPRFRAPAAPRRASTGYPMLAIPVPTFTSAPKAAGQGSVP